MEENNEAVAEVREADAQDEIEQTTDQDETQNVTEEPEVSEETEELWLKIDEEEKLPDVPVSSHIRMKQKLKGRISERDDEIEKLKSKITQLESNFPKQAPGQSKRPNELEFDSDEEYQQALAKWEDDRFNSRFQELERKRQQEELFRTHQQRLIKATEEHYDRASELIEKAGINPDVYRASDQAVRQAVNQIAIGRGDIIIDQMISNMGEGSEKVMYFLGRNQNALHQFKSLLAEDPSGIKASIYLGQQKERLTVPKKQRSRAPAPSPTANGDSNMGSNTSALKKKYDAAHKKGDHTAAWKARREARQSGVDTSQW